jgi:ParB family chromosome partitioning protein
VREAERLAQQALNPKSKLPPRTRPGHPAPRRGNRRPPRRDGEDQGQQEGAGAVTIQFGNLDQLDGLLEKLR